MGGMEGTVESVGETPITRTDVWADLSCSFQSLARRLVQAEGRSLLITFSPEAREKARYLGVGRSCVQRSGTFKIDDQSMSK